MGLPPAEIGVFGGTAFYSFLDDVEEVAVQTPFGPPSALLALGTVAGRRVAFLPRHGPGHAIPAHRVNYRANVWALRRLGVRRLLAPCSVGSLQRHVRPGDFVVCDQLVDRTSGRADTFFDGPLPAHVSFADPYCPELRELAIKHAKEQGITVHESGTVVTIQGPRFSTRAESKWFKDAGWEVINMTQYPEAYLARELEICYVNIALITDYDVGVEGEHDAVSHEQVVKVFTENNEKLRGLLYSLAPAIPEDRSCICSTALEGAHL